MQRKFGLSAEVVLEQFARGGITNDFELDGIVALADHDSCARGTVEPTPRECDVPPGLDCVEGATDLGFSVGDLFERLHGDLTVAGVLVAVPGDPVTIENVDRLDSTHLHARRKSHLQCNDGMHPASVGSSPTERVFRRRPRRRRKYGGTVIETTRISPPPDEEELLLHTRTYDVKAFRIDANTMRLRGRVTDVKPPGLYVEADPEPLTAHDMVVDLIIAYPEMTITGVDVVLDTFPYRLCSSIEPSYDQLIGTSIGRGFARELAEKFGGAQGCTHVGALLKAMAPVAIQSMLSMQMSNPGETVFWNDGENDTEKFGDEARAQSLAFVRNSCHVWADGGELVARAEQGIGGEPPLWITNRLRKLGRLDGQDQSS